ncbi:WhiB family transcriptional regulator [Gordonia sp. PKS22-38]|uniref:Transcriptional regulator WhiB n=1 Tax=Gordonia prachuapensis TaxID=3115651 RepID=A0ABU7MTM4_9ACTN|nr:WhiB family transcriptional regulator [Gordonia sp. PKS22-38]
MHRWWAGARCRCRERVTAVTDTSDRIARTHNVLGSGDPVYVPQQAQWREEARCRGADTAVFFPSGELSAADRARHERAAKQICGDCPVTRHCADYAATGPEPYGIWGGMTPTERKRRHRKAHGFRRIGPSGHRRSP